ncbi:MAG: flagellar biosynthetic protein FliR [Halieaceae bacterium]|jgi:flagellar biosynthetic protein FliR|uniref:flagellar biosynthetic protein FliR n=1 Tax=Haliea alexandrii TaxID=2448162 RepID=UPI000F0B28DD|nr:flagellar biosynthetic protein FliR [Haliea alexandrii]MCR9184139.1 flagellar biosynthetic protein FliR [Halieaceae bacterium]
MSGLPLDIDQVLAAMQLYYWPFLRVSALMLVAPIFSAANVTVRVRVLLAVLIAALVAPLMPVAPVADPLSGEGILLAAREVAIGAAMGFVMQMVFASVVVAGETLAMSMGLGFAMSVDPQNGVQVPVVSQFNTILSILLFLAIDGHLLLLSAFGDSLVLLPPGQPGFDPGTFANLAGLGGGIFASALVLALPALTAVLMTNIALGVITRAAPQLNIFAVGFPVTILVGFVFLLLGMPAFIAAMRRFLEAGIEQTLMVF